MYSQDLGRRDGVGRQRFTLNGHRPLVAATLAEMELVALVISAEVV